MGCVGVNSIHNPLCFDKERGNIVQLSLYNVQAIDSVRQGRWGLSRTQEVLAAGQLKWVAKLVPVGGFVSASGDRVGLWRSRKLDAVYVECSKGGNVHVSS